MQRQELIDTLRSVENSDRTPLEKYTARVESIVRFMTSQVDEVLGDFCSETSGMSTYVLCELVGRLQQKVSMDLAREMYLKVITGRAHVR